MKIYQYAGDHNVEDPAYFNDLITFWESNKSDFREMIGPHRDIQHPVDCDQNWDNENYRVGTVLVAHSIAYWSEGVSWCPLLKERDIIMVNGSLTIVEDCDYAIIHGRDKNGSIRHKITNNPPLDLRGITLDELSDQDRDWVVMELLR